jgi:hypothetical protein
LLLSDPLGNPTASQVAVQPSLGTTTLEDYGRGVGDTKNVYKKNPKGRNHFIDLGIDTMIILNVSERNGVWVFDFIPPFQNMDQ